MKEVDKMNKDCFVGKTIKSISTGAGECTIEFTDGSEIYVTYQQSGYYGSDCTLEYDFIPPKEVPSD